MAQSDTISVTYHPGLSDPHGVSAYGAYFTAGEAVDIAAKFKAKVLGNPHFEMKGEKRFERQQPDPGQQGSATFEENLLRERSEEYLANRQFTASEPGDAERVARAHEQVAEMRASQESDEKDKPRRTRQAKDK